MHTLYFWSMKQFLAIPLIFIMLVKPLWPVMDYIINYDYIVTHLCENRDKPQLQCDGKCYLAQLLAKENGQQEDNPFESQQLSNELVQLVYCITQSDFALPSLERECYKNRWLYIDQTNTPPYLSQPSPPPKITV